MRWDDLYVAGVGAYLPESVETAEEAIAAGRFTEEKRTQHGYRSVRTAGPGETGPTMAAIAGRQAVARSGLSADEFGLVVHTYIGHPGLDHWTPASFVQRETVGGNGLAVELKQACNGSLAALDIAAAFLAARRDVGAALITGGDASRLPYIDRWASDAQTVEGDGAGALVLSSRGGFARVRATVSYGDPSLEPTVRGAATWTDTPFQDGRTISLSDRKQSYQLAEDLSFEDMIDKISGGASFSLKQALADADAELSDVRFFLHQNIAETIATHALYGQKGIDRASTTYDWGLGLGSVSTVDQFIGLDRVIATRNPRPGDLAVLQGTGAGYVWSLAVLEFLETPHWAG